MSQQQQEIYVVNVVDRTDGVYVFANHDDAVAFEAAVNDSSGLQSACYRTAEVVCDHAGALKLIAAEAE
jgi:hypothetical protein